MAPAQLTTEFSLTETDADDDVYKVSSFEAEQVQDQGAKEDQRIWYDRLVVHSGNRWRNRWNGIVFIMLIYIATGFPYRYAFIESRIPDGLENPLEWKILESIIDVLFWIDLFLNFFFTFTKDGEEVDSLVAIIKNYLKGFFIWNLIACLPSETFTPLMSLFTSDATGDNSVNKVTRMSRLQRTTRLARLTRIGRLAIFFKFEGNEFWNYIKGTRGMRIINLGGLLLWIVHLLACGWYLIAAIHSDYRNTWVARRTVDYEGKTLVDEDPFTQWAHAMYFVLTVFTTVGFGDMSAFTLLETLYLDFTMLVGMIINSIIVGEVLNIVNSMDSMQMQIMKTKEVMAGFTAHCHVGKPMVEQLDQWIEQTAFKANLEQVYDRTMMRDLITSGAMPHKLLKMLPQYVFAGRLQKSKLVTNCLSHAHDISPRFILLLALSLSVRVFHALEVVYQLHDNPFNIFLVDAGVFAYVGRPSSEGGVDESAEMVVKPVKGTTRAFEVVKALNEPLTSSPIMLKRQAKNTMNLYPYHLFCPGSYFGDVEVLEATTRQSTARCEGPIGRRDPTLLVLHKPDYYRLLDEFPHCANAWASRAAIHERRRLQSLANLTAGRSYQQLAAHIIKKNYIRCKDTWSKRLLKAKKPSYPDDPSADLDNINMEHVNSIFKGSKNIKTDSEALALAAGVTSNDVLRSETLASIPMNGTRPRRWNQNARRTVGGANGQLEEHHSGLGISDPTRNEIAKLRRDLRFLQQSVDDLHESFRSASFGGYNPGQSGELACPVEI